MNPLQNLANQAGQVAQDVTEMAQNVGKTAADTAQEVGQKAQELVGQDGENATQPSSPGIGGLPDTLEKGANVGISALFGALVGFFEGVDSGKPPGRDEETNATSTEAQPTPVDSHEEYGKYRASGGTMSYEDWFAAYQEGAIIQRPAEASHATGLNQTALHVGENKANSRSTNGTSDSTPTDNPGATTAE